MSKSEITLRTLYQRQVSTVANGNHRQFVNSAEGWGDASQTTTGSHTAAKMAPSTRAGNVTISRITTTSI